MSVLFVNITISLVSFLLLWNIEHVTLGDYAKELIFLSAGVQVLTLYGLQFGKQIFFKQGFSIFEVGFFGVVAFFYGLIFSNIISGLIYFCAVCLQNISLIYRIENRPVIGLLLECLPRVLFLIFLFFEFNIEIYLMVIFLFAAITAVKKLSIELKFINLKVQKRFILGNYGMFLNGMAFPLFIPGEIIAIYLKVQSLFRPSDLIFASALRRYEVSMINSVHIRNRVRNIGLSLFIISALSFNVIIYYKFNFEIYVLSFLEENIWLFNLYASLKILEIGLGFPGIPLRKICFEELPKLLIKTFLASTLVSFLILLASPIPNSFQVVLVFLVTGIVNKTMSWYFLNQKIIKKEQ